MLHEEKNYKSYGKETSRFTELLSGWRYAQALPQRTKKDWAHRIQWPRNAWVKGVSLV
jgi:hypothetical protein